MIKSFKVKFENATKNTDAYFFSLTIKNVAELLYKKVRDRTDWLKNGLFFKIDLLTYFQKTWEYLFTPNKQINSDL